MIELGLVQLVSASSAVVAASKTGGYLSQLPKGTLLPSWSYFIVSEVPNYTLLGPVTATFVRVQVDCYGNNAAEAMRLAIAIDAVLSGYRGTSDGTWIQGCFRSNKIDLFDDASLTYRRVLEYEIWYEQT